MRIDEYQRIYDLEDTYWWYRNLHALAHSYVAQRGADQHLVLLDVGCGTGGFLHGLGPNVRGCGIDMHPEALRLARLRDGMAVCRGSANDVPIASTSVDVVVSLDVICHTAVTDAGAAVAEMARVLKPGGVLVLNLPAYNWLRSGHDVAVHTIRRFTRSHVRRLITDAGLEPERITHWNTLLFPAAAAVRFLHRNRQDSDLNPPNPIMNRLLTQVLRVERAMVRRMPLPFGLSVFAVARKPSTM
jgi:SAM-dependent methyltransferase